MKLIVDASVVFKWFVPKEEMHREASRLLDEEHELLAPDFLPLEIANACWKKARRKEMGQGHVERIVVACLRGIPALHSASGLVVRASELSLLLKHPVYDCIYIACAEQAGCTLLTADRRLCRAVAGTPFASRVQHLADWNHGARAH